MIIEGEDIYKARILRLRGMLKLEMKGMTRRGQSAYSIIKEEFGFKGTRQKVLDQLTEYINENILPPRLEE